MKIIKVKSKTNGIKDILVDDEMFEYLNQFSWSVIKDHNTYYCTTAINKKKIKMHRLIFEVTDKNVFIDHIDGNGLNNQKINLRICNNSQNQQNSKIPRTNKSGFKGVHWKKSHKKWYSQIKVNGKKLYLGMFHCKIEAARAYNAAAKKYFGEFAKLNLF